MGITTSTPLMTFEDFERLPDAPGKKELLEGELIDLPPARFSHSALAHRLFLLIHAALESAHSRGEALDLGACYVEMGYKLSSNACLQPDVSVTHADQIAEAYLGGAPTIAIEIISPSNTAEAMPLKTKLYFEHGAREVWRFHPKTRQVTVHVPGQSHDVGEDEVLTTPLLPGLALGVREILGA